MKNIALLSLAVIGLANTTTQAAPTAPDIYQQSYALYLIHHPQTTEQSSKAIQQHFKNDYADLFKQSKKVTQSQFVAYEQARLQPVLAQRRDMSLKQTYVRYGILDANKDQKMTLKEFQQSGMKTFDEMDKNQDGMIDQKDIELLGNQTATHDGFRVRLPISMPMANTAHEFIAKYGQGKNYATLGDYLVARDQQFKQTDTDANGVISEQEYVNEFMQRFDQNAKDSAEPMAALYVAQFQAISAGKTTIQAKDIANFAQKIDQKISQ